MPFECSKFFDKSYNFYFSSIGLNKIFKSPCNSSILLTTIILFLIIIYFPSKKNTPLSIIVKIGLYIFIFSYLILFLHGCVIKNIKKNKEVADQFVSDKDNSITLGAGHNIIQPNMDGREIIGGDSYDIYDADENVGDVDKIDSYAKDMDGGDTNIFSIYGV